MNININTLQEKFNTFSKLDENAILENVKKADFAYNLNNEVDSAVKGMKKEDWKTNVNKTVIITKESTNTGFNKEKGFCVDAVKEVNSKTTLLALLAGGNMEKVNSFYSAVATKRQSLNGKGKTEPKEYGLSNFADHIKKKFSHLSVDEMRKGLQIVETCIKDTEKSELERQKLDLLSGMTTEEILEKLGKVDNTHAVLNSIDAN